MADRSVTYVFRGQFGNLTAGLTAAGRNVSELNAKLTALDANGRKMRAGLTQIGNVAGKVGLVAAAGVTAAVVAAARFDQAMAKVQAATHETAGNMEALRGAAIKAGADTVFSASEAAAAIENLAKAGVSTKDILGGGLAGSLALASAGELDVADAAEIAATAMTQFKLSGEAVPHIADLLAAGAGKAQGDVSDMSMALKQAGLVASQAGLSIEETTGTLAAFASAGLLGSDAGTSFRTMLLRLNPQSKEAAKLVDKYNLSAFDQQGNFIGLAAYAQKLQDGLKGMSTEQRQATLSTIFGTDAIRAANVLYTDGAKGIEDWTNKVNDQGYAAETAAIKLDNLNGDLEQLRGSLETALIGAGDGAQSPLRGLVQGLTDAVNAFNKLPPAAQSTATEMLAITAITGGGLWFGAKVIKGIADTRAALANLSVEATATRAALSGITKGLSFVAALEGLKLFDAGLDSVFHTDLNTSKLATSLDDLANGNATGEIADKFGSDLHKFGQQAIDATGAIENFGDTTSKVSKFLSHVPIAGGFLSGPQGDSVENIKKLDAALADLVRTGDTQKAADIFAQFQAAATDAGVSVENFTKLFPNYTDAAVAGSGASHLIGDAMTGLIHPTGAAADAMGALGKSTHRSALQQAAAAKALKESRKAAGETARQFFGLGEKVDDAHTSLDGWIADMRKQAAALRDFTKNAQTAANKGLKDGLIRELEKAGPAGALRMKQLADASKSEIHKANQAWGEGQRAVRKYVDVVGGVPKNVSTTLHANTSQAMSAATALKRLIDSFHDRNINIHVTKSTNATLAEATANRADGGTVPGRRSPYGDKVLIAAAPGEEVITNRHGEADQFRRDRAAGLIPAYADGGTVRRTASVPAGGAALIDYGRLASAVGNRLLSYRDMRGAQLDALRTALAEQPVMRTERDLSLMYGVG